MFMMLDNKKSPILPRFKEEGMYSGPLYGSTLMINAYDSKRCLVMGPALLNFSQNPESAPVGINKLQTIIVISNGKNQNTLEHVINLELTHTKNIMKKYNKKGVYVLSACGCVSIICPE